MNEDRMAWKWAEKQRKAAKESKAEKKPEVSNSVHVCLWAADGNLVTSERCTICGTTRQVVEFQTVMPGEEDTGSTTTRGRV